MVGNWRRRPVLPSIVNNDQREVIIGSLRGYLTRLRFLACPNCWLILARFMLRCVRLTDPFSVSSSEPTMVPSARERARALLASFYIRFAEWNGRINKWKMGIKRQTRNWEKEDKQKDRNRGRSHNANSLNKAIKHLPSERQRVASCAMIKRRKPCITSNMLADKEAFGTTNKGFLTFNLKQRPFMLPCSK